MTGAKFRKMGHLTLTMPLLGGFVIQKLRLDIIYLCAKFDHSSFSPRCGIARLTIYFLNASPVNAPYYALLLPSIYNMPFQHKYGYIRDKRSEVESYQYPVKEGQRYININPGRQLFSSHPKRERDREAHLNCYDSAYNKRRHSKTKLNQIQQNTRINLN